jgi:hypothetical protein
VVALGTSFLLYRASASPSPQRSHFGIGKREGKGEAEARPAAAPGRSFPLSAPAYPYHLPSRRTMSSSSATAAGAVVPPPPSSPPATAAPADEGRPTEVDDRVASHVDPFLVEALDNPRHRLMSTSQPYLLANFPIIRAGRVRCYGSFCVVRGRPVWMRGYDLDSGTWLLVSF